MGGSDSGLWIFLGLAAAFFTLLVTVAYYEKRRVNPFAEVIPGRPPAPGTPPLAHLSQYCILMSNQARRQGYEFGSAYIQTAGYPTIQATGAVWISRDRRVLMATLSGSVAGSATRKTSLYTPRNDGTWIVTVDETGSYPVPGFEDITTVINVPFDKLLDAHLARADKDPAADAFPDGRPFDLLVERTRSSAEFMIRQGMARYRDDRMEVWSCTFRHALGVIPSFFRQLLNAIPQAFRVRGEPIASVKLDVPMEPILREWSAPKPA